MRRYWRLAAPTEELVGPRPVKTVRLQGKGLVLFRDEARRYGLLHRHCPTAARFTGPHHRRMP